MPCRASRHMRHLVIRCVATFAKVHPMALDTYLFGRSTGELQRLARQAALVEPETEELFLRSGITAGMHVLEIGSGAGDVAILAGRMVRPTGSVLGIERSADSAGLAAQRVAAAANVNGGVLCCWPRLSSAGFYSFRGGDAHQTCSPAIGDGALSAH